MNYRLTSFVVYPVFSFFFSFFFLFYFLCIAVIILRTSRLFEERSDIHDLQVMCEVSFFWLERALRPREVMIAVCVHRVFRTERRKGKG